MSRVLKIPHDAVQDDIHHPETIAEVRSQLANRLIFFFTSVGAIAIVASLSRVKAIGWHNLMYLHIAVYLPFLIATVLHRRLSFRFRTYLLLSLWFVLGIGGLVTWGLIGAGMYVLITFCILSAVLLGTRAGTVASALSLGVMSLVGIGVSFSYITFGFDIYAYATAPSTWAASVLISCVLIAVVVISVTQLNESMVRSVDMLRIRTSEMRAILDALPDLMFILSRDGTYLDFKGPKELLVSAPEGIIGRNLSDLMPEALSREIKESIQMVLESRSVHSLTYDLTTRDGEKRSFEARLAPCGDDVLVLARDITTHKRTDERLRDSEERYRTFVEQINDGIWRCELEKPCPTDLPEEEQAEHIFKHTILAECNDALARLYGFDSTDDLLGTHIHLFVPSNPFRAFVRSNYRSIHTETKERDQKGHWKYFSNNRIGIVEKDHLVRVWGTTQDITDMKRAEEDLTASRERLRALTMKLSAVEEQERRRIATYLHDQIGQSLAVVQMKLSALSTMDDLDTFPGTVQEMRSLLDEIIDHTRTVTFDLSPPVLYELGLGAAVEWIGEKVSKENGLQFEFQDDGRATPLEADMAALLFRGARELLMNVVKHAGATRVAAAVGRDNGSVFVSIHDDGIGFEPSAVEPRAGEDRFGLFSIRERMNFIGGRLVIESEAERGTRATLLAPLAQSDSTHGDVS